jgi:hypothetical protein
MAHSVLYPNFKSVNTLLYIGAIGVLLYVLHRPGIDFNASAPVAASREQAEIRFQSVLDVLDIPSDSLEFVATRYQRSRFIKALMDSADQHSSINPAVLNRSGIPLSGWQVQAGRMMDDSEITNNIQTYLNDHTQVRMEFDDELRVRTLTLNEETPTFISGDSLDTILSRMFMDVMGFDPARYSLEAEDLVDGEVQSVLPTADSSDVKTVTWNRLSPAGRGPLTIEVDLRPAIRTTETDTGATVVQGVDLRAIRSTYHELEVGPAPVIPDSSEVIYFFVSMIVLAAIVLVSGFTQIYRGRVIWARGLFILGSMFAGLFAWRMLALHNTYYRFMSDWLIGMDLLGQAILFIIVAGFAAIAYMAWESISRQNNDRHLDLVDAMWNGQLLSKELGKSLLVGYAFGGMSLALWSVGLFGQGLVFFQFDSQLGMTDLLSSWPALTTLINSWTSTWVVGFSAFGVVLSILQNRIRHSLLLMVVGSVAMGLLLTLVGRVSATTGTVAQDSIAMILYCAPLVIAYRYFGLFATLTGWWFGFMMVRLGLYIGSPDPFILSNGIQLTFATVLPFLAGFLLHRYGSDQSSKRFVPEYEERTNKQMRIEKEFQIAKDSQFALMPKSAPVCCDSEVKGFFIPSYEVGGDFFDYQTVGDELMITVVDVSGKAMKAAFSAIFTSGLLLSRVTSKHPAQVLTDINPMLHERTDKQTFITCLLARYDFNSRILRFANAGHCRPLLKRDGTIQYLNAPLPRFPLGFRSDVTYAETDFQLQPGDVVMLYSDGLPEARNPKGVLYDYAGMERLLSDIDTASLTAEQICEVIRQEILTFSNYDLADDMTVVILKVI